jgi:arsenate reductase (thioredoxin)
MAEGILRSLEGTMEVFSAGTRHEDKVNPNAVAVMKEIGIDISGGIPKDVGNFVNDSFDYVITVCDGAKEICPVFTGSVKHRLHIGFDDPAGAKGTKEEVLSVYRRVRDEILTAFKKLYEQELKKS